MDNSQVIHILKFLQIKIKRLIKLIIQYIVRIVHLSPHPDEKNYVDKWIRMWITFSWNLIFL